MASSIITRVVCILLLGIFQTTLAIPATIDLGYAKYQGKQLTNGINQYLGIRFAQPPLGNLRFRAPAEPLKETSVQDASAFRPICLGTSHTASAGEDEDCLFANVWAPSGATPTSKLPVMVFIQGGGYTQNSNANWNGTQLVDVSDRNIVFVNFNYRVGLWGFLAGEEVRKNGDLNVGLLDQRLVLKWVQKYISKFGGDPNHVVIQGVSAGAGSVAHHLSNYGGRNDNLFIGAISESLFLPYQPPVADIEWQYTKTLEAANCTGAADHLKCLRGLTRDTLQAINVPHPYPGLAINPLFYWTPVIDGDMIRGNQYNLFDSGNVIKVPVLFGTCSNEGSYFAGNANSQAEFGDFIVANYPKLDSTDRANILKRYPKLAPVPQHNPWFPSASQAYGEATFICPSVNVLNSLATVEPASKIWSYRFNVLDKSQTDQGLGVPHVFEVNAVFGPTQVSADTYQPAFETYNAPVVPLVQHYWLSFVRSLDPNVHKAAGAPAWNSWGSGGRLLFETKGAKMEPLSDVLKEKCKFWKGIRGHMQQ